MMNAVAIPAASLILHTSVHLQVCLEQAGYVRGAGGCTRRTALRLVWKTAPHGALRTLLFTGTLLSSNHVTRLLGNILFFLGGVHIQHMDFQRGTPVSYVSIYCLWYHSTSPDS